MNDAKDPQKMARRLAALEAENAKLVKINQALIERVESGGAMSAAPYAAFEHAVVLAEQVRERTEALSVAMAELKHSNTALKLEITERKTVEEQLRATKQEAERANLSKTKFLAAVSHDLLQPLSAARLFTSVLLEHSLPEQTLSLIQSASHSLADVESLLGTLVDISKLDAGVIEPDPVAFRLSDVMATLAAEYRQVAQSESIHFQCVSSRAVVHSDPALLVRILRNFLSNAMRYTDAEGRVLLGCRRRGAYLVIEVWDTGPGIPDDQLEAIFIEFRRVPGPHNSQDKGLGLGLAIVEKIARMLGHRISLSSTLGRGSVFAVEVPLAGGAVEATHSDLPLGFHNERLQGRRIWVLDNDPGICSGMTTLLENWGCTVTSALNLENLQQRTASQAGPPDLIIADYHLDENRNGLDAVAELTGQWKKPPPVLMVTANYTVELKQSIRHLGYGLINKPVRPMKLKTTLVHLLEGSPIT